MRRLVTTIIMFAIALSVAGCSGGEPNTMPDVVGKRLDIALSDVERAGFDDEVEVLGGGAFGVLDESNWTVCSQSQNLAQRLPACLASAWIGHATPMTQ